MNESNEPANPVQGRPESLSPHANPSSSLKLCYGIFVSAVLLAYTYTLWSYGHDAGRINRLLLGGRQRAAALMQAGVWKSPSFNAGTFSADTGAWVVSPAQVITFTYTVLGKTMIVNFYISGTTVSGTPNILRIEIPGGFKGVRSKRYFTQYLYRDAGGPFMTGTAGIIEDEGFIRLSTAHLGGWTAGNNTDVIGQIAFEIQ